VVPFHYWVCQEIDSQPIQHIRRELPAKEVERAHLHPGYTFDAEVPQLAQQIDCSAIGSTSPDYFDAIGGSH
jgi:hypothetical protein